MRNEYEIVRNEGRKEERKEDFSLSPNIFPFASYIIERGRGEKGEEKRRVEKRRRTDIKTKIEAFLPSIHSSIFPSFFLSILSDHYPFFAMK